MNFMGILFNENRYFYIELTKIYGIGIRTSLKICNNLKIKFKKVKEINNHEKIQVLKLLKKKLVGIDLKKSIFLNIKRLIRIKSYRGSRHLKKLPSRGQRTRTNAKTVKRIFLK
ncbi:30S ribosomal protein S13 [Candidatus Vidania fulgoroideorum]